jgi:dolichyl-phosphate beta-glucosyltransferase
MRGSVRDSQCGFKFFAESAAHELFRNSRIDGYAFDLEILGLAQRLGMQVCEVPVTWSDAAGSSLSAVADAPQILRELRTIRVSLARESKRIAARNLTLSANPAG